jgi:transcriptional regulator with XRE-family HTH domain
MAKPPVTYTSLSEYLEKSGRTQLDLAEELGISIAAMSRIVRGINLPAADMIVRIHEITGVPIENMVRQRAEAS